MPRIRLGFFLALVFGLLLCTGSGTAFAQADAREEAQLLAAYREGSLIRLHILAENDSAEAQSLKISVRDAILREFSTRMQTLGDDPELLYQWLSSHADDMRTLAEDTARTLGFEGPVSAEVGVLTLPEKQYGSVVLPDGEYRGLRITLGQGEGRNWWCVLYPSLCLAVADDDPWRTDDAGEAAPKAEETRVVWDARQIFDNWFLWE